MPNVLILASVVIDCLFSISFLSYIRVVCLIKHELRITFEDFVCFSGHFSNESVMLSENLTRNRDILFIWEQAQVN